VIFLTDGAVSNEAQVLAEVEASLGRSRLFTVAIGSAPNSYLMEHVARLGRGTFTHIGSELEVDRRMTELLDKLESPVMTDVRVVSDDAGLEVWPNPVPDLYAGEPIVVSARSPAGSGALRLDGRVGRSAWSAALDLDAAVAERGVAQLWARAKIGAVETMRFQGVDPADVDAEVLRVALAHHLVSRLTSLVAVDVTPSRPSGEALATRLAPLALPHGWDFGELPASPPAQRALGGRLLAKLARSDAAKPGPDGGLRLPQTDAGTDLQLLSGALLALAGAWSAPRAASFRLC
jgi:Ca-activated chloride channel family protein